MTQPPAAGSNRALAVALGLSLIALGGAGGWIARGAAPAAADRRAVETIVHGYLLAHPEVLPEAMDNLRRSDASARLGQVRAGLDAPFAGAVLGNPAGHVTLVEFSDYACGYCRQSIADVDALVAADPDLRVVMRELPILSPQSADAARWALAAAEQGRYAAFHRALFAAGRPAADTIAAAAAAAGLDMARARTTAASPRVAAEIARNLDLARQLQLEGTPGWVAGDTILTGAVGRQALADALKARG